MRIRILCLTAAALLLAAAAIGATAETQRYYSEQTVLCQQQSEKYAKTIEPIGSGQAGGYGKGGGTIINGVYYSEGMKLPQGETSSSAFGSSSYSVSDQTQWYTWNPNGSPIPVAENTPPSTEQAIEISYSNETTTLDPYLQPAYDTTVPAGSDFGVQAYTATNRQATTGVAIPYVNDTTTCPNLARAFTFTINGYPITVTNAAYSENGESRIVGTGSVNPFQYVTDGSVQPFPQAADYTNAYDYSSTPYSSTCPYSSACASCPYSSVGAVCPYDPSNCTAGLCAANTSQCTGYPQSTDYYTPNASYYPTNCLTGNSYFTYPEAYYPTTTYPPATSTGSGSSSQSAAASSNILAMEQASLALLNQERAQQGLASLPMDSTLQQVARLKSEDMSANNYFAHNSPTYGSAADMLNSIGYDYRGVGENLAHYEDVYTANNALMSSEGHRQNILGSQWTKAGVGVALDDRGYPIVTQLFAY
jgi:uncharacterized protein YkwD